MNKLLASIAIVLISGSALPGFADTPAQAGPDQQQMLHSTDPQVAANKRLVFDFWRKVLEGGHLELADQYLSKGYIQHNPNVPTGRDGFVKVFSAFSKPHAIADHIKEPLIAIVGEGDLVVLSFVRALPDPKDKSRHYTTTWFDMFRVENGKIVEHWDNALKQ